MEKKVKFYERALISCVLVLIICVCFKLFGANWFDLETKIEFFNKLDIILNSNIVINFLFSFCLTFISVFLILSITTLKTNKFIILFSILISISAIMNDYFIESRYINFIIDTIIPYICCLLIDRKSTIDYALCFILNIIYQILSIILRGIYFDTEYFNSVILLIMNLDYYILLLITYFYLKKGDKKLCSVLVAFGSSLQRKLWKKPTQNLKQSSNKGGCKYE